MLISHRVEQKQVSNHDLHTLSVRVFVNWTRYHLFFLLFFSLLQPSPVVSLRTD